MKALIALLAAYAVLVAAASAVAADRVVDRGIVQSVGPSAVLLRALDGTDVTVPVGPATRVRLNGRGATLAAIAPGLVAEAVQVGSGPATVVRAFGRASGRVKTGVVARVRPRFLVLRRGPGDTVRIPVIARTVVWRGSSSRGLGVLRRGMRVTIALAPTGAARVVLVEAGG